MTTEVAVLTKKSRQQRSVIKRRRAEGIKPAAIWLLIAGIASLAIWYFSNDGSMMSMLLALASVSTITLSILLFYLSPSKPIQSDVCDAMAISGTIEISRILTSLNFKSKGVYIPVIGTDSVRLFVPLPEYLAPRSLNLVDLEDVQKTIYLPRDGVSGALLSPPGYGLYQYARKIGSKFPGANLEDEIGDAMENSLELAEKVKVEADGDRIIVTLFNTANFELCSSVRREDANICTRTGCPVCSAVGCMIASATQRKLYIERVSVQGNTLRIEYRMLEEY